KPYALSHNRLLQVNFMDRFKDFQLFNSTVYKGQKKLRNVKSRS
ncbi:MAG: hypothetical protein RIQ91_777, partial [Bacteroidota bacterium]